MIFFQIEDDFHAEPDDERYEALEAAVAELRRRAAIPFGKDPNIPPCSSSATCCRDWVVLEHDDAVTPWRRLRVIRVVKIESTQITWAGGFEPN